MVVVFFSIYYSVADYLVQYDDDDWLPGKWKNLSLYPGTLNSVVLHLIPFTYYQFRVIAINEVGMSRPSRPSMRFQSSGARAFDHCLNSYCVALLEKQINATLMSTCKSKVNSWIDKKFTDSCPLQQYCTKM